MDLEVEIPTESKICSAFFQFSTGVFEKSSTIMWLSVHHVTSLYHLLINSSAITFEFLRACIAYSLNLSVCASNSATAIAEIVFICGHHCIHGNTALSILVGIFSIVFSGFFNGLLTIHLLRIKAHLGHLKDLWVVVIIT